jgi:hypothetical protein
VRRILNPSLMLLNFVFLMVVLGLILTRVTHAQSLIPPGQAYVLDHPIDPDLLILATPQGRFSIVRLSDGCDWLHGDMNVTVASALDRFVTLGWKAELPDCFVGIQQMVDLTPCFADSDGVCDVDSGEHYW